MAICFFAMQMFFFYFQYISEMRQVPQEVNGWLIIWDETSTTRSQWWAYFVCLVFLCKLNVLHIKYISLWQWRRYFLENQNELIYVYGDNLLCWNWLRSPTFPKLVVSFAVYEKVKYWVYTIAVCANIIGLFIYISSLFILMIIHMKWM